MRRRLPLFLALAIIIVAASGCTGNTIAPSSVTPTSATLKAKGDCDTQCSWFFRYRQSGTTTWRTTPIRSITGNTPGLVELAETVSLSDKPVDSSITWEYQVCGKGDGLTQFACVGASGPNDVQSFTTPARTAYAPPEEVSALSATIESLLANPAVSAASKARLDAIRTNITANPNQVSLESYWRFRVTVSQVQLEAAQSSLATSAATSTS